MGGEVDGDERDAPRAVSIATILTTLVVSRTPHTQVPSALPELF